MSLGTPATSSVPRDTSAGASDINVDEMTSKALTDAFNTMLPIVFLEEVAEKANLKAFIKYISQLQLTAEKIRPHISEKAERQLNRECLMLLGQKEIKEDEWDWKKWDWRDFKRIAESLFNALKSDKEIKQSLTILNRYCNLAIVQ